jgi:hypothetical protein
MSLPYRLPVQLALIAALTACGGSGSDTTVAGVSTGNGANAGAGATDNTPPASAGTTPPSAADSATTPAPAAPPASPAAPPTAAAPAPVASNVLPKMYVSTENKEDVTSTEDYLKAVVRIESDNAAEALTVNTEIRGRGNTTWGMPKKPYRLKLSAAASLLGMPAERNWALLANYADKTLVRNKLAMTLGAQAGLPYNPRSRYVELYVNDQYEGVYQLFEHVQISPNRIAIDTLNPKTDADPNTITGGYFLEADWRRDEDVCWDSSLSVVFCAKDPELDADDAANSAHPSALQFNYIRNYVNEVERRLTLRDNSYTQVLDADSAVKWYLVEELLRNNDARMHSSVFLYKPRGGKLSFGPLWDFDIAAGNINFNDNEPPTGWYMRSRSPWHSRLFENTDFGQRVFAKWCEMRRTGAIAGLADQVDRIVATIEPQAVSRNFDRWKILGTYVWPNNYIGKTYQDEVTFLKSWLTTRAAWMHGEYVKEYGECPAP